MAQFWTKPKPMQHQQHDVEMTFVYYDEVMGPHIKMGNVRFVPSNAAEYQGLLQWVNHVLMHKPEIRRAFR